MESSLHYAADAYLSGHLTVTHVSLRSFVSITVFREALEQLEEDAYSRMKNDLEKYNKR